MKYRLLLFFIGILFHCSYGQLNDERTDGFTSAMKILGALTRSGRSASLTSCALSMEAGCFLDVADSYLAAEKQRLIAEAERQIENQSSGRGMVEHHNFTIESYIKKIEKALLQFEDYFRKNWLDQFSGQNETATVNDDNALDETQSRGFVEESRKKKKKGKIHALIKAIIIGVVLFIKFKVILKLLAAGLQIKFFLVALAGLILNAARFYLDLKKAKEPQKVIYYEHAQHQHHYEGGEEDWSSGPGSSYWGRSYEDAKNKAHELAYAKQKPQHQEHTSFLSSWL